ncbi:MAG: cupredoxin domain-containing protein [Candidatus Woesearchaeota archaeon]
MKFWVALVTSLFVMLLLGCAPTQTIIPTQPAPTPAKAQQVEEPKVKEPVPTINILFAPKSAKVGEPFQISWKIDGPKRTITHTAVHYDYSSHPGVFGTEIGPAESGYRFITQKYASGSFDIPGTFTTTITPTTTGTLYFRVHTIIDDKHYWTDEQQLVVEPVTEQQAQLKEFVIEADDSGFTPSSQLFVNKNTRVKITFKVRSSGVYYGGLEFKSPAWGTTGTIKPGESKSVEFTATQTIQFTAFWPASSIEKWTAQIVVG